ncbi:I78 family peptidase inhibitor [Comamonas endophytica]|uniref:I78 family peptidase inhibitor n=1 Tax=Comamonas endophytica TaxID=2949090 RepID=A0ABY6G6V8_9BURK|nr:MULTISPECIES: I78 family peptidase inhibitor [unclassified Acidovorax]MCD2511379.1 proteinase inhibitor I78 [Acidovorax sp. D4N7]UYG50773.1 I78 family peptidase inhibitor [Acidovorax sp. 5MLIR]
MPLRTTPLFVSAAALALLAGCSSMDAPWSKGRAGANRAPAPKQICNAQPAQNLVGRTNTAQNLEQARQRSGAAMARVLHPGQMTTKEFNAERVNLEVDATGRILAVRCG